MPLASSSETVAAAIRALKQDGVSLRSLARSAGLDHSLLSRMAKGSRTVTPATAESLAGALERLAAHCAEEAEAIRQHTRRTP